MAADAYHIAVDSGLINVNFRPGTHLAPRLVQEAFTRRWAMPKGQTCNDIWDFRGCSVSQSFGFESMRSLASHVSARIPRDRVPRKAAIVVGDNASFGVARMFQLLAVELPLTTAVFRNRMQAVTWLNGQNSSVFDFRVYVAGCTPRSNRCVDTLAALIEECCHGCCRLEVIDVLRSPQTARKAGVFATPTIERVCRDKTLRLIGDVTDREKAKGVLGLAENDGIGTLASYGALLTKTSPQA